MKLTSWCFPKCVLRCSVVSDSWWPHRLWLARLLRPWVLPARILECVAISSSRGSSLPRDQTHGSCISCIGRWILYHLGSFPKARSQKIITIQKRNTMCFLKGKGKYLSWVGGKKNSRFSIRCLEKPKWIFWPTHYVEAERWDRDPPQVHMHFRRGLDKKLWRRSIFGTMAMIDTKQEA